MSYLLPFQQHSWSFSSTTLLQHLELCPTISFFYKVTCVLILLFGSHSDHSSPLSVLWSQDLAPAVRPSSLTLLVILVIVQRFVRLNLCLVHSLYQMFDHFKVPRPDSILIAHFSCEFWKGSKLFLDLPKAFPPACL